MMRLISIDIEFNNKTYLALVSVRQKEEGLACQVRYVDSELQHLLSGDLLTIDLHGDLKQPRHLPGKMAETLVDNTIKAISKRLEVGRKE